MTTVAKTPALRRAVDAIAHPAWMVAGTAWLIVLVAAGTLAQPSIGLYRAQERYFSAWVLFIGPLPLPGARLVLTVVFLCLLTKILFRSPWRWKALGSLIVHSGALLLLLGGFLTAYFSSEGNMLIHEGERSRIVNDYHRRELAVAEISPGADFDEETAFGQGWLCPGSTLRAAGLPFELAILETQRNCAPRQRTGPAPAEHKGFAARFTLETLEPEKEDEANVMGALLKIQGAGPDDGVVALYDGMPVAPSITAAGRTFELRLRHRIEVLPYEIELLDFEKQEHPGTSKARSYKSVVNLIEDGTARRVVIEMNEPLRHRGTTFYQASFTEGGPKEATVLAAVHNEGRVFPYVASLIMCAGLLLHLVLHLPRHFKGRSEGEEVRAGRSRWSLAAPVAGALLAAVLVFGYSPKSKPELAALKTLPVQEGGRIKPLDTFARAHLLQLRARERLGEMSALEWLLELVTAPEQAHARKVFLMRNPEALAALGLENREDHLYSFSELAPALARQSELLEKLLRAERKELAAVERQLVDDYHNAVLYHDLSRSLAPFLPDIAVPEILAARLGARPGESLSLYQLFSRVGSLRDLLADVESAEKFSDEQQAAFSVAQRMKALSEEGGATGPALCLLPPMTGGEIWSSPFAAIAARPVATGDQHAPFAALQDFVFAVRDKDSVGLASATTQLSELSRSASGVSARRLAWELRYNEWDLFTKSAFCYFAALLLVLAGWMGRPLLLHRMGLALLLAGYLMHVGGVAIRVGLLGRPPVSTLYESILFVAAVAVTAGLLYEAIKRSGLGLICSTIAGTVLMYIGFGYAAEGDSLQQLVAVLNSNFWLTIHVLTITTGYGATLLAGLVGHLALALYVLKPAARGAQADLDRNMAGLALFAVFFTLFGTILGGIWADQSWGRFWGWDPKENGALLIALTLLLLIHGRLSGLFSPLARAAGLVLACPVVALAWFGVNLLSVGLHSYGFTEGAALNLGLFCGFELLYAVLGYGWGSRRLRLATLAAPRPSPQPSPEGRGGTELAAATQPGSGESA